MFLIEIRVLSLSLEPLHDTPIINIIASFFFITCVHVCVYIQIHIILFFWFRVKLSALKAYIQIILYGLSRLYLG